jgi:hypothetical protein
MGLQSSAMKRRRGACSILAVIIVSLSWKQPWGMGRDGSSRWCDAAISAGGRKRSSFILVILAAATLLQPVRGAYARMPVAADRSASSKAEAIV